MHEVLVVNNPTKGQSLTVKAYLLRFMAEKVPNYHSATFHIMHCKS